MLHWKKKIKNILLVYTHSDLFYNAKQAPRAKPLHHQVAADVQSCSNLLSSKCKGVLQEAED